MSWCNLTGQCLECGEVEMADAGLQAEVARSSRSSESERSVRRLLAEFPLLSRIVVDLPWSMERRFCLRHGHVQPMAQLGIEFR